MKKYLLLSISVLLAGAVSAQVWQGSGITENNLTGGIYRTGNIGIGTPADPTNPLSIVSNNQNSILLSIPPGGSYMGGPPAYFGIAGIGFRGNPTTDLGFSIFRENKPALGNGFYIQDNNTSSPFAGISFSSGRVYFGKNWQNNSYYYASTNPPYMFTGNVGIPALVLGTPNGGPVTIPTGFDLYSLNGVYTPKITIGNNTGFPTTNVFNVVGNSNFSGNVGIGTTAAPNAQLQVQSTGDISYVNIATTSTANKRTRLNFSQTNASGVNTLGMEIGSDYFSNNTNDLYIYSRTTNRLLSHFHGTSGNVGIGGAADATSQLLVTGDARVSGNIGIGTNNPQSFFQLLIQNNSHPDVTLFESGAAVDQKYWSVMAGGGRFRILTQPDNLSAAQDALVINRTGLNITNVLFPNGNVGIGTPTPEAMLHIVGNNANNQVQLRLNSRARIGNMYLYGDGDSNIIGFNTAPTYSASTGWSSLNMVAGYSGGFGFSHGDGALRFSSTNQYNSSVGATITATQKFVILNNGNVGIGASSPEALLHLSSGTDQSPLKLQNGAGGLGNKVGIDFATYSSSAPVRNARIEAVDRGAFAADLVFYVAPSGTAGTAVNEKMRITSEGYVGIGTSSIPTGYLMAVNGAMIVKDKLRVCNTSGWCDYVFDKDYKLPKLSEVESFILNNKHLPEIPSAEIVEREGIDIGQMNSLLLKKIEELTLYIIDLEKRVITIEGK